MKDEFITIYYYSYHDDNNDLDDDDDDDDDYDEFGQRLINIACRTLD